MSAEKKAFALKDFDAEKILSRKFFVNLNFPESFSDEEILKDLHHRAHEFLNIDDTAGFFTVSKLFAAVENRLETYRKKIAAHIDKKLLPYSLKLLEKFRETSDPQILNLISEKNHRAKILSDKYAEIAKFIIALKDDVRNRRESLSYRANMYYRKKFAEKLREERLKQKFSQRQIAEKLGISHVSYSNYEKCAAEPTLKNLILLSRILNVSTDELLNTGI